MSNKRNNNKQNPQIQLPPSVSSEHFFNCVQLQKEPEIRSFFQNKTLTPWTFREKNDYTCLHRAVHMKSERIVKLIIEELKKRLSVETVSKKVANFINEKDSDGKTALHLAAYLGSIGIARVLLDNGADPDIKTKRGKNVMHMASEGNQPAIMVFFMAYHAQDVYSADELGSTPLHWACYSGAEEALMFLLSSKAVIDVQDKEGMTPLILATLANKERIVMRLLQHGADKNIVNNKGETALDIANKKKLYSIVNLLEEHYFTPLCTLESPIEKEYGDEIYPQLILWSTVVIEIILFFDVLPFVKGNVISLLNLSCFALAILTYLFIKYKSTTKIEYNELVRNETSKNKLRVLVDHDVDINQYCFKCCLIQQPKQVHCYVCDKCVCGFDHHCFWLNKCIGKGNMIPYFLFLLCGAIYSFSLIYTCTLFLFDGLYSPDKNKYLPPHQLAIGKINSNLPLLGATISLLYGISVNVPYVCLIFVQICRKCKLFRSKNELSYEQRILDVNYRGRKSEFLLTGNDAQKSFMSKEDYDDNEDDDDENNPMDSSIHVPSSTSKYNEDDMNGSQMIEKPSEDDNDNDNEEDEEEENEDKDA